MGICERDRHEAREAMVDGFNTCKLTNTIGQNRQSDWCGCDHGAIDGCRACVEAIAEAIARARLRAVVGSPRGGA